MTYSNDSQRIRDIYLKLEALEETISAKIDIMGQMTQSIDEKLEILINSLPLYSQYVANQLDKSNDNKDMPQL